MIDWSALVLSPAQLIFGQPITVTPTASQPGAPAYPARGVYTLKPVEEQIEGTDLFHQTFQHELGVMLADYAVPPKQGDGVARPDGVAFAPGLLPDGTFVVKNVILDGQGGATLIVRQVA